MTFIHKHVFVSPALDSIADSLKAIARGEIGEVGTLDRIESLVVENNAVLNTVLKELKLVVKEVTDLQSEIAESITVEKGAIVLIMGFEARVLAAVELAAAGNMAELKPMLVTFASDLKTNREGLAAAVAANTVADPGVNPTAPPLTGDPLPAAG